MIGLDTNVIVRYITQDDPAQSVAAAKLMESLSAEAPGFIATEMVAQGRAPAEITSLAEQLAAKAMIRRVGRPEDIAHAVAFLVSTDSGFITGQVLTVDGGRMDYIGHP